MMTLSDFNWNHKKKIPMMCLLTSLCNQSDQLRGRVRLFVLFCVSGLREAAGAVRL